MPFFFFNPMCNPFLVSFLKNFLMCIKRVNLMLSVFTTIKERHKQARTMIQC